MSNDWLHTPDCKVSNELIELQHDTILSETEESVIVLVMRIRMTPVMRLSIRHLGI